jgi:cation transporter-like permease
MGKAARNEQVKLTATYFNNFAIGFLIAGFVVPYLGIYQWFASQYTGEGRFLTDIVQAFALGKVLWGIVTVLVALSCSLMLHMAGRKILESVED